MLSVTPKGSNCFFYCKSSICHNVIILTPEFFVENTTPFNNFNIRCRAIIKLTNKCYCPRWGNSYKTFISDMVLEMREQATLNDETGRFLTKQVCAINNHSFIRVYGFKTVWHCLNYNVFSWPCR